MGLLWWRFLPTKDKKVINGKNSYLIQKILEKYDDNPDIYLDFGAITCTKDNIPKDICTKIHQEYLDRIERWKHIDNLIVFASSTGVNDINLDHNGSTCYNLAKLMAENWLINSNKKYLILRIGTIYSTHPGDYDIMKQDRLPARIKRGDFKDMDLTAKDYYLDVDVFVDTTISEIEGYTKNKIVYYNLDYLNILALKRLIK